MPYVAFVTNDAPLVIHVHVTCFQKKYPLFMFFTMQERFTLENLLSRHKNIVYIYIRIWQNLTPLHQSFWSLIWPGIQILIILESWQEFFRIVTKCTKIFLRNVRCHKIPGNFDTHAHYAQKFCCKMCVVKKCAEIL